MEFKYVDINNLSKFREAAITYEKEGRYCSHATGTTAFLKYWKEQESRCLYGYKIGDDYISGYNYFYWNFSPIQKVVSYVDNNGVVRDERTQAFPDPRDYDKYFFDYIEDAERNGNHAVVLKSRGQGYSFKGASMLNRNYFLKRNSKSYAFASDKQFLTSDGVLTKAWEIMDFIDQNTAWAKRRHYKNTLEHRRASRQENVNGVKTEVGYKSEIIGVSVDDPSKVRGKRGQLILYEEAGSFKNLLKSYQISRPSVETGNKTFGIIIVYGCVCAGTKVWDKTGKLLNIEDLTHDSGILGYSGDTYNIEPISYLKPPAKKECYRITVSGGDTLECSHDHPILAYFKGVDANYNNYKKGIATFYKAEDIKVGDYVFVNESVPVFGTKNVEYARLLGLLIGDGYYGSGTPQLCIAEEEVFKYVSSITETRVCKRKYQRTTGFFKYVDLPNLSTLLKSHKIYGQSKLSKRLPADIHTFDKNSLAELLGGYFDADGNVSFNKKKSVVRVVLTSTVFELLKQVKFELLKFGIHSSIVKEARNTVPSEEYKGQLPYIYRLYINTMKDVMQFHKNIKFKVIHKQEVLDSAVAAWGNRLLREGSVDKIKFVRDSNNLKGGFFVDSGYMHNLRKRKVTKVEHIGEQDVYNLTADTTHTYLANNFITHNTGGEESLADAMGLEELFFNPEGYRINPVPNIWSEGSQGKSGFFVPVWANMQGHFDESTGISNKESALKYHNDEYDKILKNAKDAKAAIRYKAENCVTPEDAVLRVSGSIFPTNFLKQRLSELVSDDKYTDAEYVGELVYDNDKIIFKVNRDKIPIRNFPTGAKDKPEGAIVIWEHPVANSDGTIPYGVYISSTDPYDDDESGTDSLGSTFVMNILTGRIVAEYTGRPATAKEYYENVLRLMKYYNAINNYEQNKKGMFSYFEQKNALYHLADTPKILRDVDIVKNQGGGNKAKGTMATEAVNKYGRELIKSWLLETAYGVDKLNLYTIRSMALLKELIYWNKDGNFDRVSALGLLLIYREDRAKFVEDINKPVKQASDDPYFDRLYNKKFGKAMFNRNGLDRSELSKDNSSTTFVKLLNS